MKRQLLSGERISLVRRFLRAEGRLPSCRELLRLMEARSPHSATRFYRAAEAAGYVRHAGRGYAPGALLTGVKCFSSIAAGFPSPADDELCDLITLDEYLLGRGEATFLVRVTGDSMTGAGILPGDLVVVERGAEARSGEIVVAEVDGEWTLKHYLSDRAGVRLEAANPRYPAIKPRQKLVVGGVVRGVIRKYRGGGARTSRSAPNQKSAISNQKS